MSYARSYVILMLIVTLRTVSVTVLAVLYKTGKTVLAVLYTSCKTGKTRGRVPLLDPREGGCARATAGARRGARRPRDLVSLEP